MAKILRTSLRIPNILPERPYGRTSVEKPSGWRIR
jgi:hypothetical protein